jgi:hypothetical protein
MSNEIDQFLTKVDQFAEGLNESERAMFAQLVADADLTDDDVAGFHFEQWPVTWVHAVAPIKVERLGTDTTSFTAGFAVGVGI